MGILIGVFSVIVVMVAIASIVESVGALYRGYVKTMEELSEGVDEVV